MKKYGPEVTRILAERFPKFSKVTLCMVNNPDYGVDLSAAAKAALKPKQKNPQETDRKLRRRIDVSEEQWQAFKEGRLKMEVEE